MVITIFFFHSSVSNQKSNFEMLITIFFIRIAKTCKTGIADL